MSFIEDHYKSYLMTIKRTFILVFLFAFVLSKHFGLLRNIETELEKMIDSHRNGDTSHAFSIAVKVHFAVSTLRTDLDIEQPS